MIVGFMHFIFYSLLAIHIIFYFVIQVYYNEFQLSFKKIESWINKIIYHNERSVLLLLLIINADKITLFKVVEKLNSKKSQLLSEKEKQYFLYHLLTENLNKNKLAQFKKYTSIQLFLLPLSLALVILHGFLTFAYQSSGFISFGMYCLFFTLMFFITLSNLFTMSLVKLFIKNLNYEKYLQFLAPIYISSNSFFNKEIYIELKNINELYRSKNQDLFNDYLRHYLEIIGLQILSSNTENMHNVTSKFVSYIKDIPSNYENSIEVKNNNIKLTDEYIASLSDIKESAY